MRSEAEESEAYAFISALVRERSGILLGEQKQALMRSRLSKRMRQHGFRSVREYSRFLRDEAGELERVEVVNALTTNFTQFLREPHHFDWLVRAGSAFMENGGEFRVLSAGCATGEEPYSAAFYMMRHFPPPEGWRWRILGTDISTKALAAAALGIYGQERLDHLSADWVRQFFQRGTGRWNGKYRVKRTVAQQVEFRVLNLIEAKDLGQFGVVFCRNVMIYFDRATQEQLVRRLARTLWPGGYLFVGQSESLAGMKTGLRCLQPSIYQKA